MISYNNLKAKLNRKNKVLISTATLLPSGAVEVISSFDKLDEKAEYLLSVYGLDCRLKTMKDIKILDCIVITKDDCI